MQKAHNNQQTNKDLIFEVAHEDLEIGNSKKLQAKALRSSKSSNKTETHLCFMHFVHVRDYKGLPSAKDWNLSYGFRGHYVLEQCCDC
ncbi:hypothetical protein CUMW_144910 [Citrus unshiu]|nr:hypothetical protein CUMW_144910 [Citrus unshiu]